MMTVEMNTKSISSEYLIKQIEEKYEHEIDDHDAALLIQAMGGIKEVMIKTLRMHEEYPIFNDKNLIQMHQVISTPKQYRQQTKYQPKTQMQTDKTNDLERKNDMILYLDRMDNWLADHSQNIYNKLWKIIGSRTHSVVLGLSIIISLIFVVLSELSEIFVRILWIYDSCFYVVFWTPSVMICLLSVNKIIYHQSIQTAEFWLMLISMIRYLVFRAWNEIKDRNEMMNQYLWLYLTYTISRVIFYLFFIIFIMLLDGIQIRQSIKRTLNIVLMLFYTLLVIEGWIESYSKTDDSLIQIYDDIAISLRDQRQSAAEIIWVLFIKQAWVIFFGKDKAIQLYYKIRPIIKWKENIQSENKTKLE
eukprot:182036_1